MQEFSSLIFLGLLFVVFYFMLIRPQKRRQDEHRRLIENLNVGDRIMTAGGLFGTITRLGDDDVELEVAPGTNLRFVKSAVARRLDDQTGEAPPGTTT